MVSLIDHPEKQGLLQRRPHTTDRWTRQLYLTERGGYVLDEALKLGAEWEQIRAGFSGAERDEVLALFRRVAAHIGVGQHTLPDRGTGQSPHPLAGSRHFELVAGQGPDPRCRACVVRKPGV